MIKWQTITHHHLLSVHVLVAFASATALDPLDLLFIPRSFSVLLVLTPKVIGVAIARYDFSSRDTRELSLQEGDVVKIYTKTGANGWWRGEVNGRVRYKTIKNEMKYRASTLASSLSSLCACCVCFRKSRNFQHSGLAVKRLTPFWTSAKNWRQVYSIWMFHIVWHIRFSNIHDSRIITWKSLFAAPLSWMHKCSILTPACMHWFWACQRVLDCVAYSACVCVCVSCNPQWWFCAVSVSCEHLW